MALSHEQKLFLEECMDEYSNRYTNTDEDYAKTYNEDTPPPPIFSPWTTRPRFRGNNRFRKYSDDNNRSNNMRNDNSSYSRKQTYDDR